MRYFRIVVLLMLCCAVTARSAEIHEAIKNKDIARLKAILDEGPPEVANAVARGVPHNPLASRRFFPSPSPSTRRPKGSNPANRSGMLFNSGFMGKRRL